MTGTLRSGKMSTFMRLTARTLPATRAAMATITVIGCRRANTMGFIGVSLGRWIPQMVQEWQTQLLPLTSSPARRGGQRLYSSSPLRAGGRGEGFGAVVLGPRTPVRAGPRVAPRALPGRGRGGTEPG